MPARTHPRAAPVRLLLLLLAIVLAAPLAARAADHYSAATFTAPAGWARTEAKDWLIFTPPDAPAGKTVAIYVSSGAASSSPFRAEFDATVAALVGQFGKAAGDSQAKESTDAAGNPRLQKTVICQPTAGGDPFVQTYTATRANGRFEISFLTSNDTANHSKYLQAYVGLIKGEQFGPVQAPAANAGGDAAAQAAAAAAKAQAEVAQAEAAATATPATPAATAAPAGETPAPAPAAAAAAMPAVPASDRHLQGWCVATGSFNGNYVCEFFWFRPDGHIYRGRPNGASTDADFAALAKSDPTNCGVYAIRGKELVIDLAGGKHEELDYGGGMIGKGLIQELSYYAPGARISGTFTRSTSSANYGVSGGNVASSGTTWRFNKDGTFTSDSYAGVEGRNGSLAAGENAGNGKYEILGHQVKLTYNNGAVRTMEMSCAGKTDSPNVFFLGDMDLMVHSD